MPNTLQRTADPPQGPGEGDQSNLDPPLIFYSSAERPQPTSGGCYPSGEKPKENEEDALLSELRDHLFLSKKWLLKKIKTFNMDRFNFYYIKFFSITYNLILHAS